MAIDTPARIVIMGAGPIGVEAALYGRFLGYDVEVHEQLEPFSNVRIWGDLPLAQTFEQLSSPLGRAAIQTQMPEHRLPGLQELLTAPQWLESYLTPLSQVDLIADSIYPQSRIAQIARESWLKSDSVDLKTASDELFLFRVQDFASGSAQEELRLADIVIDASGSREFPGGWGPGGMEPVGSGSIPEDRLIRDYLTNRRLVDVELGQRIAVVGESLAAQAQLVALLAVAQKRAALAITWVTRLSAEQLTAAIDSRFREQLTQAIDLRSIVVEPSRQVSAVDLRSNQLRLQLLRLETSDESADESDESEEEGPFVYPSLDARFETQIFDTVFALPKTLPNRNPTNELRLARDSASECCLGEKLPGLKTWNVMTSEPNFYTIGSASAGRDHEGFRFSDGLDQIRALFALIVDRPKLDLYHNPLPRQN